jgi:hypothetical protein
MILSAGYSAQPGRISITNTSTDPTGYAWLPSFPGPSGTYRIEVRLQNAGTGLSVVELYYAGERLGYQYWDYSTQDPKLVITGASLSSGGSVVLVGYAEGDAAARVDKIVFTPE